MRGKFAMLSRSPRETYRPAANTHQYYLFYIREEGYRLYIKICMFNYLNCTVLGKKS